MAINQPYKEFRVLELPTTNLSKGDRHYLDVGAGKYITFIVNDSLNLIRESGAEFIEKDTMADFRAITEREIWAIQQGHFKGVKLNGYYTKGDTPSPIEYYISDTSELDNGGSVIEVEGIKLEHTFDYQVNIQYFGAISDETFDNKFIFQKVLSYLNNFTGGKQLVISSKDGIGFLTSQSFNLPTGFDIICHSPIIFDIDNNTSGLIIGSKDEYNFRRNINVKVQKKTLSDWENKNSTGVEIYNLYETCNLYVEDCVNFTRGVVFHGYNSKGFVYNTLFIGRVLNCRYPVVLTNTLLGWCNENSIYINRIQNTSTTHSSKSRYGVIIDSEDGLYYNNNNIFYKPSIELSSKVGQECLAIHIKYGNYNQFLNGRNEFNSTGSNSWRIYKIENASSYNKITEGFGPVISMTSKINDISSNPTTISDSLINYSSNSDGKSLVFDSGLISKKISQYNATNLYISGALYFTTSAGLSNVKTMTGLTYNKDYINLPSSRGIVVTVSTRIVKSLFIKRIFDLTTVTTGRIAIRAYDINGNKLDSSTKNHVFGIPSQVLTYTTSQFGGSWRSGANSDINLISVSEETDKIDIIVQGDNTGSLLSRILIYSSGNIPNIINNSSDSLLAIEKPTIIANEGTVFNNTGNNIDSILGWIYLNSQWNDIINGYKSATVTVKGLVNQSAISADTASAPSATYTQSEVQAILTELRDLKTKLRTAGILAT